MVTWVASLSLEVVLVKGREEQSALLTNTNIIIFMSVSVCMVYLSFGEGFVIWSFFPFLLSSYALLFHGFFFELHTDGLQSSLIISGKPCWQVQSNLHLFWRLIYIYGLFLFSYFGFLWFLYFLWFSTLFWTSCGLTMILLHFPPTILKVLQFTFTNLAVTCKI